MYYSDSLDGLGVSMLNIFSDFEAVLKATVDWAAKRRASSAERYKCLAIASVRDASTASSAVFAGVGVYTASEVFFMAGKCFSIQSLRLFDSYTELGLSPDLTEGEVFDNASRFARLMEAYYSYACTAHTEIW